MLLSRFARCGRFMAQNVVNAQSRAPHIAAGVSVLVGGFGLTKYSRTESVHWDKIRQDVVDLLDDEEYMDEPPGPILVRLAWHSAGTFCQYTKTGGSCGATMRYDPEAGWGANAGLDKAREMLEPIKKKYPGISYSDLWIFAAYTAIEEMGGDKMEFVAGREDKPKGQCPSWTNKHAPDGKLPSAYMGDMTANAAHLRNIFNRMGFNDQEIVALSGAHALGRCHITSSGYWGPWTYSPTTLSNEYFRLLVEEKWTEKKTHEGKIWTGPMQFENPNGELMMLPSDICLTHDPEFHKWVKAYWKDDDLFRKDFAAAFKKLTELGC